MVGRIRLLDCSKKRQGEPTAFKHLRTDPAMPQADLRTEPIMSWKDIVDLHEINNYENAQESTQEDREENILHSETAFCREINELFNIPREKIP